VRLCNATWSLVTRYDGALVHVVALDAQDIEETRRRHPWIATYPRPPQRAGLIGECILGRTLINVADAATDPRVSPSMLRYMQLGALSFLVVPLLREGNVVGTISVSRAEPTAFGATQIGLLQTFADQAVIAIENVRLFNESSRARPPMFSRCSRPSRRAPDGCAAARTAPC
jgi:GAF domain-containing protein